VLSEGEFAPGVKGLLAIPKDAKGKLPAVLVIHENRGLNPHIKDVTRRMALEGFVAFGADYLAPQGGTPADEDKARDMIGAIKPEDQVTYSQKALKALQVHAQGTGKAGAMGRWRCQCPGHGRAHTRRRGCLLWQASACGRCCQNLSAADAALCCAR
jgi:Dienelactone hydrolase family